MSGKQMLAFPPYGRLCFICVNKRGQKLNPAVREANSWAVKTHLKHVDTGSLEVTAATRIYDVLRLCACRERGSRETDDAMKFMRR